MGAVQQADGRLREFFDVAQVLAGAVVCGIL